MGIAREIVYGRCEERANRLRDRRAGAYGLGSGSAASELLRMCSSYETCRDKKRVSGAV